MKLDLPIAAVAIDGEAKDVADGAPLALAEGTHEVCVSAPGRLPWSGPVDIVSGKETTIDLVLKKDKK